MMDAIDVNWCLSCGRHTEGGTAYCSARCHNIYPDEEVFFAPQPVSHHPSPAVSVIHTDFEIEDFEAYGYVSAKSGWIGKGDAGISEWARDVPPGPPVASERKSSSAAFRPPTLISSQPRPLPPTLCMSKTHPALPQPSCPIVTPRQSLPSVISRSVTEASVGSLTTGVSSISIATPASASLDANDPPSAETQKPNVLGTITAQLRSWGVSSAQKSEYRSSTVTRSPHPSIVSVDAQLSVEHRMPYSPVSFFPIHGDILSFPVEKRQAPDPWFPDRSEKLQPYPCRVPADHPAFRSRGRKPARVVS